MYNISAEDIATAKGEGLEATAAQSRLVQAFEDRITYIARSEASSSYRDSTEDAKDFAQEARSRLFFALPDFRGSSAAEFVPWAERKIRGYVADARQSAAYEGASSATMHRFERALRAADGSAYEAEVLAQDPDVMGAECLSADMAYAARLAWEGSARLDAPAPGETGQALIDVVADRLGIPADLLDSDDITRAEIGINRDRVHEVLSGLGPKQRFVLKAMVGIDPVGEMADDVVAEEIGVAFPRVRKIRNEGKAAFRSKWTARFGEYA